jgi:hypothetical protein
MLELVRLATYSCGFSFQGIDGVSGCEPVVKQAFGIPGGVDLDSSFSSVVRCNTGAVIDIVVRNDAKHCWTNLAQEFVSKDPSID